MIIDNSGTGIASLGRDEDRFVAHVAPGERVVPPVISADTQARLSREMMAAGLDPDEYIVGPHMSINPITGQPEFGFLSKVWKKAKKVIKKIAPIASVIPGPWQPFAAVYQKGNALNNIAKGDGGIGDLLTLGAGGSQKIFGEGGALKNISSGGFKTMGGGFTDALKNIGQVDKLDKLGNVVQGETVFNPFRYGAEIGKTYGENQKQGYGGIFSNVGGADTAGGQAFNAITSTGNPAGGIMNAVGGPQGQMMMASGQQPAGGNDDFLNYTKENFVEGGQRQRPDGQIEALHKDGTYYTMDEAQQYYNVLKETNQLSQPIQQDDSRGTSGQSVIGMIEDMIKGKTSNAPDHFIGVPGMNNVRRAISKNIPEFKNRAGESGSPLLPASAKNIFSNNPNNSGGMFGGNMGAAGLAALYGKVVYDATKEREGGIAETPLVTMDQLGRYQMAKNLGTGGSRADFDLAPAPLALDFAYGGEARQYFNQGGIAMVQDLDMREGGESEGPGTGTSDDIPAMLSDGEFVMTAAATRGAGAFNVNKTKSGIELIKGGSSSREKGVENMRELMNIFEAI